jgi:hypothetical protein
MAENAKVPQEPTEEPQGSEADWEVKYREAVEQSRKWEGRAKANKDKADKWDAYQQEGLSEAEKLAQRAEAAETKLAAYEAEAQRRKDAAEVSEKTGVPVSLLMHCADRSDMEVLAKEYAQEAKVPAAAPAPQTRVIRGDGAKPSTADQFAVMAQQFFRH